MCLYPRTGSISTSLVFSVSLTIFFWGGGIFSVHEKQSSEALIDGRG